jgi:hypothetical protein
MRSDFSVPDSLNRDEQLEKALAGVPDFSDILVCVAADEPNVFGFANHSAQ